MFSVKFLMFMFQNENYVSFLELEKVEATASYFERKERCVVIVMVTRIFLDTPLTINSSI